MTFRSSAWSVHYDLRPSKQASRMIMVDALLHMAGSGIDFSSHHYLGMGANHFIDFRLMHRHLHIRNMTSLEHDEQFAARCEFSVPYGCIEIYRGRAADYLSQLPNKTPMIVWLDFDWAICKDIVDDLYSVGSSIAVNSVFWATIKASMPKDQARVVSADDRFEFFSRTYGNFLPLGVSRNHFTNSKLPSTIGKIFSNIFIGTFRGREGHLFRISRLYYSDNAEMITCGAALLDDVAYSAMMKKPLKPYSWVEDSGEYFEIPDINLTSPERTLLDKVVTSQSDAIKRQARKLGFDDNFLGSYKEIYRFLPKYAEILP